MANKGLSMRKVREVLRLHYAAGLSTRAIARSLKVSPATVGKYIRRAEVQGLSWPLPEPLDDAALERRLLAIARADGSYPKLLASLAKTEVLVIDDFGLAKLSAENRRDLLEITEDRYGIRSTVITSQLPVENWHDIVGEAAQIQQVMPIRAVARQARDLQGNHDADLTLRDRGD